MSFHACMEASDMELVTTKRTNGDENAGSDPPGRNDIREKRQKTTAIFKPCENSEEPAVFVPFPISISDAPDSEHSMPFRMSFHRTTKSQAEQQKR